MPGEYTPRIIISRSASGHSLGLLIPHAQSSAAGGISTTASSVSDPHSPHRHQRFFTFSNTTSTLQYRNIPRRSRTADLSADSSTSHIWNNVTDKARTSLRRAGHRERRRHLLTVLPHPSLASVRFTPCSRPLTDFLFRSVAGILRLAAKRKQSKAKPATHRRIFIRHWSTRRAISRNPKQTLEPPAVSKASPGCSQRCTDWFSVASPRTSANSDGHKRERRFQD